MPYLDCHNEPLAPEEIIEARKFSNNDGLVDPNQVASHLIGSILPNGQTIPDQLRLRDFVANQLKELGIALEDRKIHASAKQVALWWNFKVSHNLSPTDPLGGDDFNAYLEGSNREA